MTSFKWRARASISRRFSAVVALTSSIASPARPAGALAQFDTERARKLYNDLLDLDPHDVGAKLGLATCALREGKHDEALTAYERIATDASLGKTVEARARESMGDLDAPRRRRHESAPGLRRSGKRGSRFGPAPNLGRQTLRLDLLDRANGDLGALAR